MDEAGIFPLVKKLLFGMVFVWLTLMSAGASAHAMHYGGNNNGNNSAYKTEPAHHPANAQENPTHAAVHGSALIDPALPGAATSAEPSHTEICEHSHCGHAHVVGMPTQNGSHANIDTAGKTPTSRISHASSHVTNNIERPKWPVTTPAVVNLQS